MCDLDRAGLFSSGGSSLQHRNVFWTGSRERVADELIVAIVDGAKGSVQAEIAIDQALQIRLRQIEGPHVHLAQLGHDLQKAVNLPMTANRVDAGDRKSVVSGTAV